MTDKAYPEHAPPRPDRRPPADRSAAGDDRARREAALDAGLEETFPASDPVSIVSGSD